MLISLNLLKKFVDTENILPKDLALKLTMSTVEVEKVSKIKDDVLLEIDNKSLTHRPDLWGHYGIARELSVIFKRKLKPIRFKKIESGSLAKINIKVIDEKNCFRYLGAVVDKVKVGPSPKWLKETLERLGIQSINNIVDITNYVMIELGQPMHAFDFERISGVQIPNPKHQTPNKFKIPNSKQIIVRRAKKGEKILALDNNEYLLDENNLVIADKEKPIALAGIIGGQDSGISPKTETIILESANFYSTNIRRSSLKLGIKTESSIRFEKGLSPYLSEEGIKRAINLIQEIVPQAEAISPIYDIKNFKKQSIKILFSLEDLERRIGQSIQSQKVLDILKRLGFLAKQSQGKILVKAPFFRQDINIFEDLVEEVARLYGYDKIQEKMPKVLMKPVEITSEQKIEKEIKRLLVCGFDFLETQNYIWEREKEIINFNLDKNRMVEIENFLTEDQRFLRKMLLPKLVFNAYENLRFYKNFRIFELAKVFNPDEFSLPIQDKHLAGLILEGGEAFYKIKEVIENISRSLNSSVEFRAPKSKISFLDTRQAEIFINNNSVGFLGQISSQILLKYDLKGEISVFELNFSQLIKIKPKESKYQPISRFPASEMDLAIVIDQNITWKSIEDTIKKTNPLIKETELFDIYQGEKIGPGKKNLAFRLKFLAQDRTLKDEEVNKIWRKVMKNLEEKLGAKLRDF